MHRASVIIPVYNAEETLARCVESVLYGRERQLAVMWPVLPVVYSDKTLRVLEDLSFDGDVVDLREDESWSNAQSWKNHTPLSDVVRHAAERHFEKVDTVIGREQ